jgi:thiol-disulfide isomerase/thioredoxin
MNSMSTLSNAFSLAAMAFTTWLLGGSNSLAGEANQMETTRLAPGWDLRGLDSKTVHSTDFMGNVVVLDFWATWCPPCRAEIPGLVGLQKKYGAHGLAVVAVSVDEAGLKAVKSFAEKNGVNYPVVLTDNKVVDAYGGIDGLPTTFIIDRAGHIVKRHLGFTAPAELEREVAPLLDQ